MLTISVIAVATEQLISEFVCVAAGVPVVVVAKLEVEEVVDDDPEPELAVTVELSPTLKLKLDDEDASEVVSAWACATKLKRFAAPPCAVVAAKIAPTNKAPAAAAIKNILKLFIFSVVLIFSTF